MTKSKKESTLGRISGACILGILGIVFFHPQGTGPLAWFSGIACVLLACGLITSELAKREEHDENNQTCPTCKGSGEVSR